MPQQNTLDQKLDLYTQQNHAHRQRKKTDVSLLGYSVAAGMAMIAPDAMSAVVYGGSGFSLFVSATTAGAGSSVGWDIDGDGNNDVRVSVFANLAGTTSSSIATGPGTAGFRFNGYGTSFGILASFGAAKNLSTSQSVQNPTSGANSSTSYMASSAGGGVFGSYFVSSNNDGNFVAGSTGYIGLRFGGGTGSAGLQFAWAKILFDGGGDAINGPVTSDLHILEWAYDNSGAPIHVAPVSAVPLPGAAGLMLLGMGSFGLTALRKRKQQYLEKQQAKA